MGLRKIKIDMKTEVQGVCRNDSMSFDEFFALTEKFLNDKKLEGLRVRTIEDYKTNFRYLKEFATRITKTDMQFTQNFMKEYIYFMSFEKKYSPFTCNIRLRSIKAFLNWLYDNEYLKTNLSLKIKLLKVPEDTVHPASDSDIKKLLDICNLTTYSGYRDFCAIITILDCGIRIGELTQLIVEDIDTKNSLIRVRSEVSKTVVERILPICKKTCKYLQELCNISMQLDSIYVFQSTYGGEIKKQNLQLSISRVAKKAKVQVTPYQLRHTFATNSVKQGMSIFHLQKIMGHSVIQTTRQYVQLDTDELKLAHNKYSVMDRFI